VYLFIGGVYYVKEKNQFFKNGILRIFSKKKCLIKENMVKRIYTRRRRAAGKADLALKMVRKLNRSVEVKHNADDYVNVPGTDPINPAGVAIGLSSIALGTDGYERVGEKVAPKYLDLRCLMYQNSGASAFIRVVIVKHKQAQVSSDLILQSTAVGGETIAPYNIEWKPTFKVLYDRQFVIDSNNVGQSFHKRIKLNGQIVYNQGSPTPLAGGYTMYVYSSASTNTPYLNVAWDLGFTDL